MNTRKTARVTNAKVVALHEVKRAAVAELGRGAHFAKLFRKLADGEYEADVFGFARLRVIVVPDVDLALVDHCLATQEIVLVGLLGDEPAIFGALRTKHVSSEEVVMEAPKKLVLRAGKSKIELSADGKVKLSSNEMTIDAPREVRIASAHVEIP